MAELTNAIQKFFIENSRLGIPVVFHEECLHGHAAVGGTSLPQPIALAATFDPALVESLFTMTAAEARLRGTHQALTPVVDVARDPRWGRVEETYGEDPYLVSRMGIAAVRGFQGDATFADKRRVIATLKHFAAHGAPESGMKCAPTNISMRAAETRLDASGNFDLKKAQAAFKKGHGLGQVGRPSDAGGGKDARGDGRTHQRHPAVLPREQPSRHPGCLSRGMPARPRRGWRDEFPATHRAGGDVRSGAGRVAVHHDRRRGAGARNASGAHAGGGRGARPALGAAWKRPTARIRTWCRAWASRRCGGFRATPPSATRSA